LPVACVSDLAALRADKTKSLHVCNSFSVIVLCGALCFLMTYCGIEFYNDANEDNGEIAIVHLKWFTPRKKEILWPPYKMTSRFNKALTLGEEPNENWQVYSVKRIFFECGMCCFKKSNYALQKCVLYSRLIYIHILRN